MLLLCLALAAQVSAAPRHDLATYLRLAAQYRTYRSTASVAAVEAILGWNAGEIEDALRTLRSNERRARSGALGPDAFDLRLVEAAALMHVEAGLNELQRPNEPGGVVQLAAAARLVQWTAALASARAREAASPGAKSRLQPRLDPATLHSTVAAAALALGFPEIAERHAEQARHHAPADTQALLTAGCAHEGLAHLREVAGARDDARQRQDRAIGAFKDVLAVDPAATEARLRLGRLYAEASRFIEAEPLLERAAREGDDRQRYLALLFLARAAEKRADPRRAGELYSRALEVQPDGTAARLGLALQLERQAGPASARTVVIEALSRTRRLDTGADPWSSYLFGRTALAAAELKRVWEEVLR